MQSLIKSSSSVLLLYLLTAAFPLSLVLSEAAPRISTAEAAKLGVGQNIKFVEQLIHESVASKQILESDNQEARDLREKAIKQVEIAKEAQSRGDNQAVADALSEAKKAIFKGMQLVGKKVVAEKKEDNYQRKRKSLESLLEAHQRIATEKGADPSVEEVEVFARTKLEAARAKADKGNHVEALNEIESAYQSVKFSLTKLRDGKTLVRSLHFETKEDEYRYEVGRNDTHLTLVNTALKDKREDPRLGKLMDIPLAQAEKLRAQAESEAAKGDFEAAIKTMENSTKQIIKAIRMAGIFIPG